MPAAKKAAGLTLCRRAAASRQLSASRWKLEAGSWKLEAGSW